ncbi:phosphatidylinositol N-acetylglucosaminyltransferase subunit gpi1 [Tulasnella sp. 419]|nr:phosphatidylinositol N-acetylglucosaminyltransferase subunit gpi1 [Tulasnella sp. 419]
MSSMFNGRRNSNRQVLRPMLRAKDAMGRYIGFLSRPLRSLSALISSTCNVPLPGAYRGDTLLKDISATVQQVDVRTEQSIILPQQFKLIQYRNKKEAPATVSHYISFYNCIWLILNDVIIGSAVGAFLYENSDVLGQLVANRVQLYSVQSIQETLLWLDNWPVGLKLNTQLSRFFCSLFMGITNIWGGLLLFLYPYFPHVVAFVGISGRFGVTMILSLFSDFLSFSTAHLYVCYIFATVVVSQCLSMSGSLWRLFRGKRRNVLRNRTDSWDYDIDQLLLGTILFTLLTFLFPTVLVYYSLFVLTRLAVIFIHAGLETCLSFMNHFPLFAMMLRLKDPSRLPGGIYFVCSQTGQLELKNQPIPFSHIFFQYIRVWSKVSAHYDPRRLLRCIFTASFITPIQRYKIRYAMISSTSLEREERIES